MKRMASLLIPFLILIKKASNNSDYFEEESCPPSSDILPCTCNGPQHFLLFHCDKIIDIKNIISASQSIHFGKFSLTNSRIQSLEVNVYWQFDYIYMRKNTLKKIGKEFLDSSRDTLKRIEIIHNDVEKFPFKELSSFSKLEYISLKYNSLKSIPDEAFGKVFNNKIKKIDLSFNKINHIGANAFKFLTNLELLDLQYNKLTVLNNMAFATIEGNSKFQLNLSHNKIMYISEGAFQNQVFKNLNLTDNNLTMLQEKVFREVLKRMAERRTGVISVGKNRFHCTCDKVSWIVRLPILYKLPILEFECSDKKSVQDLTQHDIGCSTL